MTTFERAKFLTFQQDNQPPAQPKQTILTESFAPKQQKWLSLLHRDEKANK